MNKVSLIDNWPDDLVCIINGRRVYKSDILDGKRRRQARRLAWKLRPTNNRRVPCFVWVFNNGPTIPYGGWWLYVRTIHKDYRIDSDDRITLKIMSLFPCGLEPEMENLREWRPTFALEHSRPTRKRPEDNGLAVATAVIDPDGWLVDIESRGV